MTPDPHATLLLMAAALLGTSGAPPVALTAPSTSVQAVTAGPTTAADVETRVGRWSWPLSPRPRVTKEFVPPVGQWGAGHRGIDLAATAGQVVTAVEDGTVTHVGQIAGRGTVSVTHRSGVRSTYEPVDGAVARGEVVRRGQPIGVVAGESHCGANCLHIGALRGRVYLDPRPFFRGGPVVLLPLQE